VNTWIVNASPLILLGKINRLDLLEQLCRSLVIPYPVSLEILAGPDLDPAKIWILDHLVSVGSMLAPSVIRKALALAGETV